MSAHLVTGMFRDSGAASAAVDALMRRGIPREDISLLLTDRDVRAARELRGGDRGTRAAEGAGIGGTVGGALGAAAAAIAALGTVVAFPGVGVVVAGPIAAALLGAGAGGALGALTGALAGAGIPRDRAEFYEKALREHGVVVGATARTEQETEEIERLFEELGAVKIRP